MDSVNNNQFEVKPFTKRKITPCPNVYLNPALDLLANEDRICNTAMEIPIKKRKHTKSVDVAIFENSGLDLEGKPVNEVLVREIDNVRRNFKHFNDAIVDKASDKVFSEDAVNIEMANAHSNFKHDSNDEVVERCSTKTDEVFKFGDTMDVTNDNAISNTTQNVPNREAKKALSVNAIESFKQEPIYGNLNGPNEITATIPKAKQMLTKNVQNVFEKPATKEVCPLPVSETSNDNTIITKDSLLATDISRIAEYNDKDSGISVLEQRRALEISNISDINTQNHELSNMLPVNPEFSKISHITNIQSNVTNQVVVNNSNLSLSFIDRLALDSPNVSERSLFYDDDLNESNIMEIKTITIITKKKRIIEKKNTNPFLNPNLDMNVEIPKTNPFLDIKPDTDEMYIRPEEKYQEEIYRPEEKYREGLHRAEEVNDLRPRRLFIDNTNSTISTVNESSIESQHEYENIYNLHSDPIYENIEELNKQSKILGHDVSQFSAKDIINKKANNSNESNESKKEKHSFFKAGKLSKIVFKTLKKTFKHDKTDTNVTLNPYEVPRKPPKQKIEIKESGIENPALNLDNSDDLEFEELTDDEEHQYETIKTMRNTRLNMNVTPLRERNEDVDLSNRLTLTPGKKVRFDSTLNREKVITGNSFDYSMASPGFDAKIEKYHDELENCINERKFLQQNM